MITFNWEPDDWYNWQAGSDDISEVFAEIERAHYFYRDGDMVSGDFEEPESYTWEVHFIEVQYGRHLDPPERVWHHIGAGTTSTFTEAKWKAERAFDRWWIQICTYEQEAPATY